MCRRILFAILSVVFLFPLPGDVIVVTWNMKWFPSGKADLRAEPEYERENIARAGRTLAEAVDDQRRSRKEKSSSGLVVFAQEMRDAEVDALINSKHYPAFSQTSFTLNIYGECRSCQNRRRRASKN